MTTSPRPAERSDVDLATLLSRVIGRTIQPRWITARTHLIQGTFPKDLVHVEIPGQPGAYFFIKYDDRIGHGDNGPRGGVTYEARVYEDLLPRLDVCTVRFYGRVSHSDGNTILVLEGLPDAVRVKKVPGGHGLVSAARWLGSLHRQASHIVGDPGLDWVRVYTDPLLQKWCDPKSRSMIFPRYLEALSFLSHLAIPELLAGADSIIHGEYYPKNVLFHDQQVYPVDWESAARGPTELDLAMLIDGWPGDVRKRAINGYAAARWHHPPPEGMHRRLMLAEMILHARWLRTMKPSVETAPLPPRRLRQLLDLHAEVV